MTRNYWNSVEGARERLASWTREEPEPELWPPYPIVANADGEMARLYIGSGAPEGWTVIGMNCARTAALKRIGTPTVLVLPDWAI
jgi:hypothetical protein